MGTNIVSAFLNKCKIKEINTTKPTIYTLIFHISYTLQIMKSETHRMNPAGDKKHTIFFKFNLTVKTILKIWFTTTGVI